MKKLWVWMVFTLLGLFTHQIWAAIEVYSFDDPVQEGQYRTLVAELRCPKCQNQNLADSDAPLAKDIKDKIYEKIRSGESKEDIVDYMVGRYGDFIRYRPPFKVGTAFLWLFPCFLLLVFVGIVAVIVKRQRFDTASQDKAVLHQKAMQLQRLHSQEQRPTEDS